MVKFVKHLKACQIEASFIKQVMIIPIHLSGMQVNIYQIQGPFTTLFWWKRIAKSAFVLLSSLTGNIAMNGAILTWLYVSSLKGLAFDWFWKLPPGSIKVFSDMESLFLTSFFDDDSEVSLLVLFSIKQTENESVSAFIEKFHSRALRYPGDMDKQALVETCPHNFQTPVLT